MAEIRCVSCAAEVESTTVACPECGEDPRTGGAPRTCEECGTALPRDAISCNACGARVADETPDEPAGASAGAESSVMIRRGSGGWASRLRSFVVLLDGDKIGKLSRGSELSLTVAPGPHTLAVRVDWESSDKLEFVAEPGRDLAFECGHGTSKGDVAAGVVDGVVSSLVGGGPGSMGQYWVRQLVEPSGGDEQADVGPTPPDPSG